MESKIFNWKFKLSRYLKKSAQADEERENREKLEKLEIKRFHIDVVTPVFEELKTEWEKYDRQVQILNTSDSTAIIVSHKNKTTFRYMIKTIRLKSKNAAGARSTLKSTNTVLKKYNLRQVRAANKAKVAKEIVRYYKRFLAQSIKS